MRYGEEKCISLEEAAAKQTVPCCSVKENQIQAFGNGKKRIPHCVLTSIYIKLFLGFISLNSLIKYLSYNYFLINISKNLFK